jgi:hypothetical protein
LGVYGELGFGKFYFRNDTFFLADKKNSGKDWYKIRGGFVYKFPASSKTEKVLNNTIRNL